jgi:hypothetical protein
LKKSTPGKDYFKVFEPASYTKYDEDTGVPTMDKDGKEINENQKKGFIKK